MKPKVIETCLLILSLLLAGFAFIKSPRLEWSDSLKKHAALGLHHRLSNPVLALQLAATKPEFDEVLEFRKDAAPAANPGVKDQALMRSAFRWDYLFIVTYTLFFAAILLRLIAKKVVTGRGWITLLALGIALTAFCDVLENHSCLVGLEQNPPAVNPQTARASHAKWLVLHLTTGAMSLIILRTLRPEHAPPVGGAWCLGALLLAAGAVLGLIGCCMFRLVLLEPAVQLTGAAVLPLLFGVWERDPDHDHGHDQPQQLNSCIKL